MAVTRIYAVPMLGRIQNDRVRSLQGCHALTERAVVKIAEEPSKLDKALGDAVRELMLADRVKALEGKVTLIIEIGVV